VTSCIGCGCEDDAACEGGCYWVAKGPRKQAGLCSECVEQFDLATVPDELLETELEWEAAQFSIAGDYEDAARSLILPGDPEYSKTLRREM
jgi:hypothetical protein